MRPGFNNKTVLSEVTRDLYTDKEANERKEKRKEKDLQEVVRPSFGERLVLND